MTGTNAIERDGITVTPTLLVDAGAGPGHHGGYVGGWLSTRSPRRASPDDVTVVFAHLHFVTGPAADAARRDGVVVAAHFPQTRFGRAVVTAGQHRFVALPWRPARDSPPIPSQ